MDLTVHFFERVMPLSRVCLYSENRRFFIISSDIFIYIIQILQSMLRK